MTSLARKVSEIIGREGMLQSGQSVLLAVSGGMDSMVLLALMRELSEEWRLRLSVFHFDHQLRDAESSADAAFVRGAAKEANLPFYLGTASVGRLATQRGISVEMAAREARHESMAKIAAEANTRVAATAHHADDQVELFFLRVLRGSGGEGLAGMKRRGPSPADPRLTIIRPLLEFSKTELRAYLDEQGLTHREDSTNASSDFLRNRLRNHLLPLLTREYSKSVRGKVLNLMENAGADSEATNRIAVEWLALHGFQQIGDAYQGADQFSTNSSFEGLHRAIQRKILIRQLYKLGITPRFDLVEQLRMAPGKAVAASGGLVLRGKDGLLQLESPDQQGFDPDELKVDFKAGQGAIEFGGASIGWHIEAASYAETVQRRPGREVFDADAVGPSIRLRHWRAGDRFHPIGMASEIKVQDYFTNEKVLRKRRHELIFGCTGHGEVFWIEGMRISERFKLTSKSKRELHWSWLRH